MPKKFFYSITILSILIVAGVVAYSLEKLEPKAQQIAPLVDSDLQFLQSIAAKGLTYDEAKNLPVLLTVTSTEWTSLSSSSSDNQVFYPKRIKLQPRTLSEQDFQALGPIGFNRQDLLAAAGKLPVQKQLQAGGTDTILFTPEAKADENLFYTFGDELVAISYGTISNASNESLAAWFRRKQYLPVVDLSLVKATTFNAKPGLIIAYGVDQLNMCAYVEADKSIYSYCFGGDVPPERMKDYLPLLEEIATRSTL